jgi:protein disulfide-isomerase A6
MEIKALGVLLLLNVLTGSILALYSSSDDVVELTSNNFHQMKSSDDLWLVEFYAPWCGHCQSLAPAWKQAATALKGVVKVAAVDMDKYGELGSPYGIQGFPTIKIFAANKNQPLDYNGGRDASSIVEGALSHLQSMVRGRLGGGRSSGGGSSSSGSGGSDVVELTDDNFDDHVFNSNDGWLVEFYAPWCGHCKALKPHWENAARELKGKLKVAALDATVHRRIASVYGIQGFPTIKFFPPKSTSSSDAQEYDGGRTTDDIVRWGMDKSVATLPPPELKELTSPQVLTDACAENQLCVVSILPVLLDCQAQCRNNYLQILRNLGEKFKRNQWGWVWTEAGAQQDVENALGIGGFGYPAMAAVNARKKIFAILKGPFSETGIHEFLRALSVGRGQTEPLRSSNNALPNVKQREAWDGQDGKPPVEEEIDLSELDLEPKSEL